MTIVIALAAIYPQFALYAKRWHGTATSRRGGSHHTGVIGTIWFLVESGFARVPAVTIRWLDPVAEQLQLTWLFFSRPARVGRAAASAGSSAIAEVLPLSTGRYMLVPEDPQAQMWSMIFGIVLASLWCNVALAVKRRH